MTNVHENSKEAYREEVIPFLPAKEATVLGWMRSQGEPVGNREIATALDLETSGIPCVVGKLLERGLIRYVGDRLCRIRLRTGKQRTVKTHEPVPLDDQGSFRF